MTIFFSMTKRITIKEIAKNANVSIGTVDRVLHNRGRVAEATKNKILEIAKKGNYSSNVYARSLKLNKLYKIGTIIPEDISYWQKQMEGISMGIKEQESLGFTLKKYSDQGADRISVSKMHTILKDNPDGLILTPNMLSDDGEALKILTDSKIPYVFVDSNVNNSNCLAFIGQDSFQSGLLSGSLLDRGFGDPFELYIVTNHIKDLSNKTIRSRIEGLESYFANNQHRPNDIHHVNFERDNIDVEQFVNKFSTHDSIIHLFVPSSRSYVLGEKIAPLKEQLKLRFVGYDLIEKNVVLMNQGVIDFLIHQKPKSQGYLAVQTLFKHLILKADITENQYMPIEIIKKENLIYCDY